ncbi:MAG: DUF3054 domain-containing protein [Propioniciclava sp.]|uniref:DUF3054 domain-containing protein n=1 Tax=Propioniciclava sp. TaxID=2038686 RepID=UPI0039E3B3EC
MNRGVAILLDLVMVVAFVVIGRASHTEPLDFDGIQRTALPFVAGLLIAWIGFLLKRHSGVTLVNGVFAWAMTLALGVLFRLLLGDTAEVSFIIVSALFLAATIIGWRLILWLVKRARRQAPKAKDPRRSGNPAKRNAAR